MEIDAIDNGINQATKLAYRVRTNLSSRVKNYNIAWNAPKDLCYNLRD